VKANNGINPTSTLAYDELIQADLLQMPFSMPINSLSTAGPPGIPVLKVTNSRPSFGKIPKIPVRWVDGGQT